MMQSAQSKQVSLIKLFHAKENCELQEVKKKFTESCKYYFIVRNNTTIAYDKGVLYIIHKEYLKIADLGKNHKITDLAYNYEKHIIAFLTADGALIAHFINTKTQILIKKQCKKVLLFDWVYGVNQNMHFFLAEQDYLRFYKIQEDRKGLKEIKSISGKYCCCLYEPLGQLLAVFTSGDCQTIYTYSFQSFRFKNWFKGPEIAISFSQDQNLQNFIRKNKTLGLEGSRINKQIFAKSKNDEYFIDILRMHNIAYLIFYFSNEGKLKLTPLLQGNDYKEVIIKLPSDAVPSFNIVDNMLVVHLRNEKITFLYDISMDQSQMLVSPFPLMHQEETALTNVYRNQFLGKRAISPNGEISKWNVNLPVIYHYLKNQMQIFDFLNRRTNSKMEMLKWLRENLFSFKQINISKIWKSIFIKSQKAIHEESDIVTMLEIYSNIFYTLSLDELINKDNLVFILIECIRQAGEFEIKVPVPLQNLTVTLLLLTKKYQLLTYLCHHDVLRQNPEIVGEIFAAAEKENDQLLFTLALDLGMQVYSVRDILRMIMKTQRVREAKRFVKMYYEKIEPLDLMEVAKYLKDNSIKKQYIKFSRFFIAQKYPHISIYLDEAEQKLMD